MSDISLKNTIQQELMSSFTLETRSGYQNGGTSLPSSPRAAPTVLGFGNVNRVSRESPLGSSGPGSPLQLAACSLYFTSRWDLCNGCSCHSTWKHFPLFSKSQTNVTTQKNVMFFILICFWVIFKIGLGTSWINCSLFQTSDDCFWTKKYKT